MDNFDVQLDLEETYSRTNLDRLILNEIDTTNEPRWLHTAFKLGEQGIDPIKATEALWIEILRDPGDHHIQSIGSRIGARLGFDGLEAIKVGSKVLTACADIDIYDIVLYPNRKIIKPTIRLDDHTLNKVSMFEYVPPMVCKPNPWKSNNDGGWLSFDKHVVLGKGNRHHEKQNLDCLNTLQEIEWHLDMGVVFNYNSEHPLPADHKMYVEYIDKPFYFVWRYDKRGRMYSEGYHINLQSDEYRRAALSMGQMEICDEVGLKHLKIAVANAFGHDKLTFQERVEWVDDHDEFDTTEADEPIFAFKYLQALQRALNGEPINTNVFLDATASGMQISAALSNCEHTARHVNMIDTDRKDVYTEVMEGMNRLLDPKDHVDRAQIKKPVMTHYYNSEANPRESMNANQLEAFYRCLRNNFSGAEDVMASINECWTDQPYYQWTLPDGHVARIRAKVTRWADLPFFDGRFDYAYTSYEPSGNGRHLAPNIIHSIDGYIAREMVKRANFPLAHIHDAFTSHPNNMDRVCELYREIMAEISSSDLLQDILREVTGNERIKYDKLGPSLSNQILHSRHMLS